MNEPMTKGLLGLHVADARAAGGLSVPCAEGLFHIPGCTPYAQPDGRRYTLDGKWITEAEALKLHQIDDSY